MTHLVSAHAHLRCQVRARGTLGFPVAVVRDRVVARVHPSAFIRALERLGTTPYGRVLNRRAALTHTLLEAGD